MTKTPTAAEIAVIGINVGIGTNWLQHVGLDRHGDRGPPLLGPLSNGILRREFLKDRRVGSMSKGPARRGCQGPGKSAISAKELTQSAHRSEAKAHGDKSRQWLHLVILDRAPSARTQRR